MISFSSVNSSGASAPAMLPFREDNIKDLSSFGENQVFLHRTNLRTHGDSLPSVENRSSHMQLEENQDFHRSFPFASHRSRTTNSVIAEDLQDHKENRTHLEEPDTTAARNEHAVLPRPKHTISEFKRMEPNERSIPVLTSEHMTEAPKDSGQNGISSGGPIFSPMTPASTFSRGQFLCPTSDSSPNPPREKKVLNTVGTGQARRIARKIQLKKPSERLDDALGNGNPLDKHMKRALRNREHARNSRKRRKEYMEGLDEENNLLSEKVSRLEQERERLRSCLDLL